MATTLPSQSAYSTGLNQQGLGYVDPLQTNAYAAGTTQPAQYGVYDKPADRRLAPWIVTGSILLFCFGVLEIIFTFVKQGTGHSLWGLLVSGIILAIVAVFGLLAGLTRRSQLAGLFFWLFVFGWFASLVVLIVNGALLDNKMDNLCGSAGRATLTCQDIREYHIITYTAFGVFFALWVTTFLIAAGYFWRMTRLYRKEPYEGARHDAYGNRYPVGQPAL